MVLNDNNFILILHDMLTGDIKVSPQQLYIYSFIFRKRIAYNNGWLAEMSISDIHKTIPCKIDGKKDRNQSNIIYDLECLRNKGFIFFENKANHKTQIISFSFLNSDEIKDKKFVRIPYGKFDMLHDKNKYWFYCFVAKHGRYGVSGSFNHLSKASGLSSSLLRNHIVKDLNSDTNPRIFKFSGSYVNGNSPRQEENRYYSDLYIPKEKKIEYEKLYGMNGEPKFKRMSEKRKRNEIIDNFVTGEISVEELVRIANENTSWQKTDRDGNLKEITQYDYDIYRLCADENVDEKFVLRCIKAIESMKNNAFYSGYDWEQMEINYLESKGYQH